MNTMSRICHNARPLEGVDVVGTLLNGRHDATIAALVVSFASLAPGTAWAANSVTPRTYYVDDSSFHACSESGPGTQALPLCTIQRAAALATVPGDVVSVSSDVVNKGEVDITASGTASAPIRFVSGPAAGKSSGVLVEELASGGVVPAGGHVDFAGLGVGVFGLVAEDEVRGGAGVRSDVAERIVDLRSAQRCAGRTEGADDFGVQVGPQQAAAACVAGQRTSSVNVL